MVQETMFMTTMQNSHKYTSLKLFRKVSLKCIKLIPFCEHFQTVNNAMGVAMLNIATTVRIS